MKLFDRWGNMLYQSDDINEGWDGTFSGRSLSSGVYVYHIFIAYLDNSSQSIKGSVLLAN